MLWDFVVGVLNLIERALFYSMLKYTGVQTSLFGVAVVLFVSTIATTLPNELHRVRPKKLLKNTIMSGVLEGVSLVLVAEFTNRASLCSITWVQLPIIGHLIMNPLFNRHNLLNPLAILSLVIAVLAFLCMHASDHSVQSAWLVFGALIFSLSKEIKADVVHKLEPNDSYNHITKISCTASAMTTLTYTIARSQMDSLTDEGFVEFTFASIIYTLGWIACTLAMPILLQRVEQTKYSPLITTVFCTIGFGSLMGSAGPHLPITTIVSHICIGISILLFIFAKTNSNTTEPHLLETSD